MTRVGVCEPEQLVVDDLAFTLRLSSHRRTIGITVDRDGALILRAPADADSAAVRRWVQRKRGWVYRKLAEKDLLLPESVVKNFASGESFEYLGRRHRLRVVDGAESVKLHQGRLVLPKAFVVQEHARTAIVDWYRYRGLRWLPEHVAYWSRRMFAPVEGLEVRDIGYRWGSLGKGVTLNLHWAVMQLPPSLVHYVLVHELAHVGQPNHTPSFWAAVARALPDYETRKARLAKIGAQLWLG